MKELVVYHNSGLKGKFRSPKCKVPDLHDVTNTPEKLHVDFVLVPADKAANIRIMVCKKCYIDTLIRELGINTTSNANSTYIPCTELFNKI